MKIAPFVVSLAAVLTASPALAAGGAGAETSAQPASRLEMAMSLYAGGITMGHMSLDASLRGSDYHAVSTLETSGVINAFWQSQIQATSSGKLAAKNLAPALYESASLRKRSRISRQGLTEHRDALMGIAWGLSLFSPSFAERDAELRARGMAPIQARVALARNACRLAYRLLVTQQPFDEEAYRRGRLRRGR